MKPTEIVTAILAIYAAILSTLNFLIQLRSTRWRIAVTPSVGSEGRKRVVTFRAVNLGERTVTLNAFYVHLPAPKPGVIKRIMRSILIVLLLRSVGLEGEGFYSDSLILRRDASFPFDLAPGKAYELVLNERFLLDDLSRRVSGKIVSICGSFEDQTGESFESSLLKADLAEKRIDFL